MHTLPAAFVMGCAAAVERSMMDKRRWPRTHLRSGDGHMPAPSGPRCDMRSRIVATMSILGAAVPTGEKLPVIPHMMPKTVTCLGLTAGAVYDRAQLLLIFSLASGTVEGHWQR